VGYFGYYFAWVLLSFAIAQPWLLVGLLVLWLLRRVIPRPGALFGAMSRAGRLRHQVALNRANVTARRDLATIYIDLLRPRRAVELLEEGLALAPEDPELLYLSGFALQRAGRHEEAIERLVRAVDKDHRLRHGHPYLVAGDALLALKRWNDAIDAYERFLDFNSSDVTGHTQLARAYAGAGDRQAARKWLLSGLSSWHGMPGAMKRRQLGAYLRAQWARITVLKDAGAMLVALLLLGLFGLGARAVYPVLARLFEPDPYEHLYERLEQSLALCGTVQTGDFAGVYLATPEPDHRFGLSLPGEEQRAAQAEVMEHLQESYENFEILPDRIVSGSALVQEFCLTRMLERTPQLLRAEAIWHEDRNDPGDAWLIEIRLVRGSDSIRFSYAPLGRPLDVSSATLRKRP
jgi:tetratricopeptide (TPR) repeat protein